MRKNLHEKFVKIKKIQKKHVRFWRSISIAVEENFQCILREQKIFLKDVPPISPFRRNLNGDGALTLF